MLEVPGITPDALDRMKPRKVAGLRWGLFARAFESLVSVDLDAAATALADEEKAPSTAAIAVRRGKMREQIAQARKSQAMARQLLLLDDEDDD